MMPTGIATSSLMDRYALEEVPGSLQARSLFLGDNDAVTLQNKSSQAGYSSSLVQSRCRRASPFVPCVQR